MTIYKRKTVIIDLISWVMLLLFFVTLYFIVTYFALDPQIPAFAGYMMILVYVIGILYGLYREGKWLLLFLPDLILPKVDSIGIITNVKKIPYLPHREKGRPIEYTLTETSGKKIKFKLHQDWDEAITNQLKRTSQIQLIHSQFLNIPFKINKL